VADTTRYVNTASTAGGDGTTNAISGANRAYASLNEWEAAEQSVINAGDRHIVYCEGASADTTQTTIDGWTVTDAESLRIIGNNHTGRWETAAYRLVLAQTGGTGVIDVLEDNVYVENIQAHNTTTTASANSSVYVLRGAGTYGIESCIFRGSGTGSGADQRACIDTDSITTNVTVNIYNNVCYDSRRGHYKIGGATNANYNFYNNTLVDNYGTNMGLSTANVANIVNSCLDNGGNTDYSVGGVTTLATSNNVTSDATSPDGASYQNKTFTFVDKSNGDLHLASSDTGAMGNGVGPGSDANVPASDIDNDVRSGSTCDCGADEFRVGFTAYRPKPQLNVRHKGRYA
jgi:hypothetical protein